nr:diguanylate cyclase [Tepidibacillus sp. HK-1]
MNTHVTCSEDLENDGWFKGEDREFFNVYPSTIVHPSFPDFLGKLKSIRFSNRNIVFEINEAEKISDMGLFKRAVHYLKDKGYAIALDDYGKGAGIVKICRILPFKAKATITGQKEKIRMMNRKLMYVFILASLAMVVVVNYYSPLESLWMLLLIPAIATVVLFPTWKATITVGLSGFILMVITEFVFRQEQIQYQDGIHLIITGAVEWVVFTMISSFRIKVARLITELEHLALTDPLTKIYNRRYLDLYMEKAIPLSQRREHPMTLIMFDIDHFKTINDTYGHNAGDMVLKKVTRVIEGIIRDSDVFVRTGGEEFMIVLPNGSLEQGIKFAERIRKTVEGTKFVYKGKRILVTISLGITEYIKGQDLSQFIEKADQGLYRAKETGRNRIVAI